MNQSKAPPSRIGFSTLLALLTLTLVSLKLCGVITAGWLWVLSPVWIVGGVLALVVVSALAPISLAVWLDHKSQKQKRDRLRRESDRRAAELLKERSRWP